MTREEIMLEIRGGPDGNDFVITQIPRKYDKLWKL
jgi:hypothetical protein